MFRFIVPLLVILLFGLQQRLWIGDGGLMMIHSYRQQVDLLTSKAEQIEAENQDRSIQISQMRHNISAIESLARYDLGMIGKNEQFFLFDKQ